jgi:hypothetical protein
MNYVITFPIAVFLICDNSPLVPLNQYPYAGIAITVYSFIRNFPVEVNTLNRGKDFPRF